MNHRLLKYFWVTLVLLPLHVEATTDVPDDFKNPLLGHCFKDTNSFLNDLPIQDAVNDENIHISSKNGWTWVVDQTATENYTWYLLKSKGGGDQCFQLYVPSASNLSRFLENGREKFKATISPEVNLPAKEIIFNIQKNNLYLVPGKCFLLKAKSRKVVSCAKVIEKN